MARSGKVQSIVDIIDKRLDAVVVVTPEFNQNPGFISAEFDSLDERTCPLFGFVIVSRHPVIGDDSVERMQLLFRAIYRLDTGHSMTALRELKLGGFHGLFLIELNKS